MKHTPGPWKTLPCPVHGGKHPLHNYRWIVTEDTEVEYSQHVPNDWRLSKGSLICQMRDTQCQPYDANLIASAPDLLEALKWALDWIEEYKDYISDGPIGDDKAYLLAQETIRKAEGVN